jgi:molybdenum cofactor guanylyltransferase
MDGVDKTLLQVGSQPMLRLILGALAPLPVAINANGDPVRFAGFRVPVVKDELFAGEGPLAGVLAGLAWARSIGADSLLTIPGDTPFVPPGLASALSPAPACAGQGGRRHHLVALWPVACHATLEAWLSGQVSRSVASFSETIGMRVVEFPRDAEDLFLNVNTPVDLADARRRARTSGCGE